MEDFQRRASRHNSRYSGGLTAPSASASNTNILNSINTLGEHTDNANSASTNNNDISTIPVFVAQLAPGFSLSSLLIPQQLQGDETESENSDTEHT
jgi:hypothetical protein